MNKPLLIGCFFTALVVILLTLPAGAPAMLLTVLTSLAVIAVLRTIEGETKFLIEIFLGALLVRILFGTLLHVFDLREFFGGDAMTYDYFGNRLKELWTGEYTLVNDVFSQRARSTTGPGWGMNYLTAIIYLVFGQNILAAQFFCAVFGAATAPLVYVCSHKIFHNVRVSKLSSILVAFLPAFIIWSGQLLKDGLMVFLLVLAIVMVLRLQEKFDYFSVAILIFSMFGIISLRFYIFYMVAIAVVGSFLIGKSGSVKSIIRGFIALAILGIALSYLGVLRSAGDDLEKFGSLERIERSRRDMSDRADSGFGEDLDVSTTQGALTAIPIGFIYLMLAPFPWQISSLRSAITLPEIMVWWAMIPLMISGLWFTIKNRLRNAVSILIFTFLLTLSYSIFQGNVGTAYRQRTQIQVFLVIFIAVGWTLLKERRENQIIIKENERHRRKF